MYYRHFGLQGPPFRFSPSATPLFLSSAHRECLAALEWALVHDESGFMLLLGETGMGKTTLLNAVRARRLPRLRLACVANPRLSFEEMMRVVLPQLGVRTDQRGKLELIQQFEAVVSNRLEGHRTAIVIDEAQEVSDGTLEDLRLLANRVGPQEQELQIVLMGHPELLDRLSASHLRQLRERISTKVSLLPLSPEESIAYVEYRLMAQGGSARQIFKPKALRYLVDAAAGIPRRLNVLCHNALVLAFSKNASVVTMDMAVEVVIEYQSILGASPAASAPAAVSIPVHVAAGSPQNPIRLEEEAPVVEPRRKSIYAAGACAALALIGFGRLLFATTQSWTEEVNRAVPAIAGVVRPANPQPSAELYAGEDRSVAPSVAVPAPIAPISVKTARTVAHAPAVSAPMISRKPVSAPASRAIRIQEGDTFHDLAEKYLGSKYRARDLIKANPQINDPDLLYVGETVYLPSARKNDESRLVQ
jgi:type II secretory pathway predicted ATPase ExeA/nucleoid-associated protein YgaU